MDRAYVTHGSEEECLYGKTRSEQTCKVKLSL
jgi:hypothetical protein